MKVEHRERHILVLAPEQQKVRDDLAGLGTQPVVAEVQPPQGFKRGQESLARPQAFLAQCVVAQVQLHYGALAGHQRATKGAQHLQPFTLRTTGDDVADVHFDQRGDLFQNGRHDRRALLRKALAG
eukprot:scaffold1852_cov244-Pinguiococcus_pyrenoidosus.AAC.3